eukprot:480326-Pyramimonas_sp.AAC.2
MAQRQDDRGLHGRRPRHYPLGPELSVGNSPVRAQAYFKELGIEESTKKRILPTKFKSYTGFEVDSVQQMVTAEVAKQDKYAKELTDLKASRTPGGEVNRRALSRVIGKYQHLTPVVQGGEQLLTEAYRSRDQAPLHRSTPLDWGDTTNV